MSLRAMAHYYWTQKIAFKLAWWLPKSVVMWAYIRVISGDPDPDAGTRMVKPIDVVSDWSRYHSIYPYQDERWTK